MECSEPEDAHHFREQFRRQFGVARAVYDQLLDELRNVPGLQDGKTRTDAAGKQRGKREAKPLCTSFGPLGCILRRRDLPERDPRMRPKACGAPH